MAAQTMPVYGRTWWPSALSPQATMPRDGLLDSDFEPWALESSFQQNIKGRLI
jgi:hypothetical protein